MAEAEVMPAHFPADDPQIANDDFLYLRVFPRADQIQLVDGGGYRPSSGALGSEEPLSTDWSVKCTAAQTRDRDLGDHFHVAAIRAGVARSVGCRVVYEPVDGNDAHVHIYGLHKRMDGTYTGALRTSQAKKIARQTQIVLLNPLAAHH